MKNIKMLLFILLLVLPAVCFGENITACGGSQLYCVTDDGVIHSNGVNVGNDTTSEGLKGLNQFNGSFTNNDSETIAVDALLVDPTVTVGPNCGSLSTGCDIDLTDFLGTIINPSTNNNHALIGFTAFPNVINRATTVDFYCSACLGFTDLDNSGTIIDYAFLYILGDNFRTGVTQVGTITNLWGIRIGGGDTGTFGDIQGMRNNLPGVTAIGVESTTITNAPSPSLVFQEVLFSALGAAQNGTVAYCSDCTFANPCAGSGTGAIAKRLNGAWRCD
jgi:hypothetical protein